MMLADIRDWLKTFTVAEHYYIGKLDGKKEKSLGVYQRNVGLPNMAIGGLNQTSYRTKSVSILLHWNRNAAETEKAAFALYEKIISKENPVIGDEKVYYIKPQTPEPVDVGTDEAGVYERVIWLDLYFERK
ncbi:MAG: minor capsid protein [Emergencia sp.]|nr:minor capsid protein [Emergencia sp.]